MYYVNGEINGRINEINDLVQKLFYSLYNDDDPMDICDELNSEVRRVARLIADDPEKGKSIGHQ